VALVQENLVKVSARWARAGAEWRSPWHLLLKVGTLVRDPNDATLHTLNLRRSGLLGAWPLAASRPVRPSLLRHDGYVIEVAFRQEVNSESKAHTHPARGRDRN
jgi:hypothetical protein